MHSLKISLLLALSLVFIGCSSTPQSAIENTFDALKNGHFPQLMKNTTYPISKAYSAQALAKCSVNKKDYANDDLELMHLCLKEEYANIKVENIILTSISENETKAEVTVLYDKRITHIFSIQKIDEQWRLAPFEQNK